VKVKRKEVAIFMKVNSGEMTRKEAEKILSVKGV
jgi:hypothetical protein